MTNIWIIIHLYSSPTWRILLSNVAELKQISLPCVYLSSWRSYWSISKLTPLGSKKAATHFSHLYSIFVQLGLHYVVSVSLLSPWLFKACLFHVDGAFIEEIIKFIQQPLKVSSHRKACGENSLSELWSYIPKHLLGFQGVYSPAPRARISRLKNPSELQYSYFQTSPCNQT